MNKDEFRTFPISPDDPLAEEHAAISNWVAEALASHRYANEYYQDVALKTLPAGRILLDAELDHSLRYVRAAIVQVAYWDNQAQQMKDDAESDAFRTSPGLMRDWASVWGPRRKSEIALRALMRRNLPYTRHDLLSLLKWSATTEYLSSGHVPLGSISHALERYAAQEQIDAELREAMNALAGRMRASHSKDVKRMATSIEHLGIPAASELAANDATTTEALPPPNPAPAGHPAILDQLKRHLGMLPRHEERQVTLVDPDLFLLRDDSPLRLEHDAVTALVQSWVGHAFHHNANLDQFAPGRTLLEMDLAAKGRSLLAAVERQVNAGFISVQLAQHTVWAAHYAIDSTVRSLMRLDVEFTREGCFDFLLYLSTRCAYEHEILGERLLQLVAQAEEEAARSPLTEGERYVLWRFRASVIYGPPFGMPSETVARLTQLIGDQAAFFLVPGEKWSDMVNNDLAQLSSAQQVKWLELLRHALNATAGKPSAKWLSTAAKLVSIIGQDDVAMALSKWFAQVSAGRSIEKFKTSTGDTRGAADVIHEENAACLRGLLWIAPLLSRREDLIRPIASAAMSAYKKVPGVGPRAVKVGNAAIYALSEMASLESVGQLAVLKVRVKFGTAQKEIEKAFQQSAEKLGLPRNEIEEMGVPSYGLEGVGHHEESLGDYRAEIIVNGSDAELKWFDAKGKQLKSVPAKVKSDHKDDLKELQQSVKDIQGMLPAQRDRIDGMFLSQTTWPIETWRERYLLHPLVGTIARRLIWCIDGTPALFIDGTPRDVEGRPVEHGKAAEVTLWHPVGRAVDAITAWRRRLEDLQITQPFKQAHREVYFLTDAERNTGIYSNRYAAHIIRQHQFNALCSARGWKNMLRLMVDNTYPPATKELPQWGLRAEYWVDGIGDDYGSDTNESGVYLRLATDQVRFYRIGAAANDTQVGDRRYMNRGAGPGEGNIDDPLPLSEIPPLVFSEIMRDVDLFVGVASVGNDPNWQDGGPGGRYRDYWQSYSFGDLSGTATTRKQVLERLVPRLKIAKRCSFSDRFLVVRGDKRTYKIHIGSGNILMEPNDQYLCIVPDARARAHSDDVFLPFEGDSTLSIIISKAFLLANDTKITDPTIVRQIDTL